MVFLVIAALLVGVVGTYQILFLRGMRRHQRVRDWDGVLRSVEAVNLEGIQAISRMFLNPTKDQLRLQPPEMWQMLGGPAGITAMRSNADAMLSLCVLAERWDSEGIVIAELIRSDAIKLRKALFRIELNVFLGIGNVKSHFALMEAAASYDLMVRRLYGLYATCHVARLQLLEARLGCCAEG